MRSSMHIISHKNWLLNNKGGGGGGGGAQTKSPTTNHAQPS